MLAAVQGLPHLPLSCLAAQHAQRRLLRRRTEKFWQVKIRTARTGADFFAVPTTVNQTDELIGGRTHARRECSRKSG